MRNTIDTLAVTLGRPAERRLWLTVLSGGLIALAVLAG
jgi:hypothetical protein